MLGQKQMELLGKLRSNARAKLTSISRSTNIPISTLFDILKDLQGEVIKKSTVLIDFEKLGYNVQAQVILRVKKENKCKLRKHLECHSNINTVYKINNSWDFMIETIHRNVRELDGFLENIDEKFGIEDKQIHYLIDEVKKEGFMMG